MSNIDEVKRKIFIKSFEEGKKTSTKLNAIDYFDYRSNYTGESRDSIEVSDAQGFHVMKISETEAFKAFQELRFSPCYSFEKALEKAGIEYREKDILRGNSDVSDYIAVYTGQSGISVYHVDGKVSLKQWGNVESYTRLMLEGQVKMIGDVKESICDRGVRHDFVSDGTAKKIEEAVDNGICPVSLTQEEKKEIGHYCGDRDMKAVSFYGVPVFDKSGKLKDFQMMSITKKEDGSFNAPIPLRDEKGKVVKFSVDEYLKFENEVAQANDSMIRPYVKQSKKTEGNTNSNSMDLQR